MKYVIEIGGGDERIQATLPRLIEGGDLQLIGPWRARSRDILPVTLIGPAADQD